MPALNGTGPLGQGPMTGRGLGYCTGYPVSRYIGRRGYGLGYGWFDRGGRGFRNRYWATGIPGWASPYSAYYLPRVTEKEEMDILREEAELLKRDLDDIQNRINELKAQNTQEDK